MSGESGDTNLLLPLRKVCRSGYPQLHKLSGTCKRLLDDSFLGLCVIAIKLLDSSEAVIKVDLRSRDIELCISLC